MLAYLRSKLDKIFTHITLTLITILLTYSARFLQDISLNVNELKVAHAVVQIKVDTVEQRIASLENLIVNKRARKAF